MADDSSSTRVPAAGACVRLTPLVRRVVAGNPGPFTFTRHVQLHRRSGRVAIVDPGPRPARACRRRCSTPCAARRSRTSWSRTPTATTPRPRGRSRRRRARRSSAAARTGRARAARRRRGQRLEASADLDYAPDRELPRATRVEGAGWRSRRSRRPGHMANHLASRCREERALFSADHVMAWSTTVVAPPDGVDERLHGLPREAARGATRRVYWPGHGGPVREPQRFVRALIHHRRQREASILDRLAAGRPHHPGHRRRRSTRASTRRCAAPRACRSSPIWRTSSRAASSRPRGRRRLQGEYRLA